MNNLTNFAELSRRVLSTYLVAVSVAGPSNCSADYTWGETKFHGRTMGTTYHVVLQYNSYDFEPTQFEEIVEGRLAEINSRMSTYDPESELSKFNASRSIDWFDVSDETAKVVTTAIDIAKQTGGAFDPTVGPLVNLWGFGPEGRRDEPPSDKQIAEALSQVRYQAVEARLDPPALRKSNPNVKLDLSAIAKGYAADSVTDVLVSTDRSKPYADSAMVEIGGEVRTHGKKLGRDESQPRAPWRLGLERPDANARMISKVVEIGNGDALATSGDYRIFFEHNGKRYSHTIHPNTGRPVEHALATATVRAPTCMEADAIATALMVMGPKDGLAWANAEGVAALLVERIEDGHREYVSAAWTSLNNSSDEKPATKEQSSTMGVYFLITAIVFAVALTGMAIGVIASNRRIQGSCGGLAGLQDVTGKTACELCSNPSPTCSGTPEQRIETGARAAK